MLFSGPMENQVQMGQLIAGKYRVEQLLGRGGMGVVMAALHEQLNQRVALKFLTDDAYQQPEAVTRFLREARAAVQIQSEHVARVTDVGTLESGAPYMVMEYLRGQDLKEVSMRRGPLPVVEAVDYLLQACDAVAEAHSLGIVHRDLKPSNLFLTERADGSPLVKVLDFGISKALHKGETSQLQMTASAAIMGSPQYMSPEQIRSSKNVDARADVWALGTILHELLTGAPAYVADTVPGLLAMIVADPPPPLCASRPDAPAELEAVILRCLEKDRERRFSGVGEFARAIERFASNEARPLVKRISRVLGDAPLAHAAGRPGGAVGNTVADPAALAQTNGTWASTGRRLQHGSSARLGVWLAAAASLVGIAVGGWLWLRPSAGAFGSGAAKSPAAAVTSPERPKQAADLGARPPPKAATPATGAAAETAPAIGLVRPLADTPAPPPSAAEGLGFDDEGAEDLFVKEAKAPVKADPPRARKPPRRAPPRRAKRSTARATPSERKPAAPAASAPAPASGSKKLDGIDLFNDTK